MSRKIKVAVCSEIHAKHMDEKRAPRRIFQCYIWWYPKLPLDFKMLRQCPWNTFLYRIYYLIFEYRVFEYDKLRSVWRKSDVLK
jgi:hypothetical protein